MSEIKKVVGRPVEALSYEWDGDFKSLPVEWRALDVFYIDGGGDLVVRTTRGPVTVYLGDRIMRRQARDFYPIDPLTYAERWDEQ